MSKKGLRGATVAIAIFAAIILGTWLSNGWLLVIVFVTGIIALVAFLGYVVAEGW